MRSHYIDTGLYDDLHADDDPMISEDGYGQVSKKFDEAEMLEALELPDWTESEARLPPQEAYEAMKFMAPLDKGEEELLEDTPFVTPGPEYPNSGELRYVDDSDHDEWIYHRQADGTQAMDHNAEDQMFGESDLAEEEVMDLLGTEVGFKLRPKKLLRGAGRGLRRAGRTLKKIPGAVKKLLTAPARAALRGFKRKLAKRRAAYTARKAGRRAPNMHDTAQAQQWSKQWLASRGGKYGRAISAISGDDFMGAASDVALVAALVALPLPTLSILLGRLLTKASKEGAPASPGADAAPEGAEGPPEGAEGPSEEAPAPEPPAEEPPPEEAAPEEAAPEEAAGWLSGHSYERAVRRRAARLAGNGRPTPAHVARAVRDVDRVISRNVISCWPR